MQHFYNTHIFKSSLESCREEGIACDVEVEYVDNVPCIDLISSLVRAGGPWPPNGLGAVVHLRSMSSSLYVREALADFTTCVEYTAAVEVVFVFKIFEFLALMRVKCRLYDL